jgi:soluble lytic murein transglycosylase-like protein
MGRVSARLALLGLLALPVVAGAGELYSYIDSDGVIHFSNAPSDQRFREVTRASDAGAGVYKTRNPGTPAVRKRGRPDDYEGHIKGAAEKYKLPPALIRAVMAVESNFDPRAVSEKGAVGLMQLMPGTARDMFVADIWDPAQNIDGGARYLRVLANQYEGDMVRTLAAYNAGPEAVRRSGGAVPNIPETKDYVRKVVALYHEYKARP